MSEYVQPFVKGIFENRDRSLFYRKSLGYRRFFEEYALLPYKGELLYPSGFGYGNSYLDGMLMNGAEMTKEISSEFRKYRSLVPYEHSIGGNMYTHSMPHYERILKEGLNSYEPRIKKIEDPEIRDGLLELLAGIRTYIARCVSYLESVNAPERLINALKKVPLEPAENIYEAIESWNFVMYLDCCDNLGCLASGLAPYYKGEDITDLISNLYDNLDANNGYSMQIGAEINDLIVPCLKAAQGKRRPMIELFVSDETPEEVWDAAIELVRTGGGQPAFYNKDVMLKGMQKRFPKLSDEDALHFCGGGCAESMIAGYSNVGSLDAGMNTMWVFQEFLYAELEKYDSYEEFYKGYMAKLQSEVARVADAIATSQKNRAEFNPLPMRTLLIDDCIDNGKDYNNGGARYMWSVVNIASTINLIDSMLVVRDLVFEKKTISAHELVEKLKANDDEFIRSLRKHENHFGIDNENADKEAKRISEDLFSMFDGLKTYFGDGFLPASIQFNTYADAGEYIHATPDGRHDKETLADSLAAIFNKDTEGPTALIKSITKLDLEHALGTPIVNFNVDPSYDNNVLKGLIKSYIKLGGVEMQISCTSRETLLDAMEHPEDHKNLVVRVGGYAEYFCKLHKGLQLAVLNRTISQL